MLMKWMKIYLCNITSFKKNLEVSESLFKIVANISWKLSDMAMTNSDVEIRIKEMIAQGCANCDVLLTIFDQAEAIPCEFMFGQWRGAEIKTGHPIEGLLELSKWYGKVFNDNEHVYPLIFLDERKGYCSQVIPSIFH